LARLPTFDLDPIVAADRRLHTGRPTTAGAGSSCVYGRDGDNQALADQARRSTAMPARPWNEPRGLPSVRRS
jgi:hypothetical protein